MKINKHTLFMRYPSTWWHDLWREGLVTGNGEIGANVFGGVKEETILITHHDLWHRGIEDNTLDVSQAFLRQRKLMEEEKFLKASWEVVNELREKNYRTKLESQLPLAALKMTVQPNVGFTNYSRAIHMDSGEVESTWKDGDSVRTSKLFVSRVNNSIGKKISSNKSDLKIEITLNMYVNTGSSKHIDNTKHIIESKQIDHKENFITYYAKNEDDTYYGMVSFIDITDGIIIQENERTFVKDSSSVTILSKVFIKRTKEELEDVINQLKKELKVEFSSNSNTYLVYESLLKAHSKVHKKLYSSAELSLGSKGQYRCNEDLLAKAFSGQQPLELMEKLWRYGRYLFICGTSPKSNPFPLYGLWPGDYDLIWSHNMANENTQMTYWHTNVGNLIPFQQGLYEYYNKRIPTYQNNAKKIFGMNGIYMTAGTTPGVSTPNQIVPVIMNWVGAAGWIAQHYCDYYWYTKDKKYLHEIILPYIEEVATFYEEFIEFYSDGTIHFYPSVSPENTPGNFMPPSNVAMAHPMPTTVNSTIDLAIVKEFFTNIIRIAKEEGLYTEKITLWDKILSSIPPYKCNKIGAIKEWQDDRFDERYAHRHLSHLYPVFPGIEVNDRNSSELLPAFKKAVDLREIDAQTGWSMAHMAAIYARLGEGEQAMDCLNNMAKSCLTNNFFSLHNDWRGMNISLCMDAAPVQLDAIMGYVNGIQEMLVYTTLEFLKLLPALPKTLSKGQLRNFRYRDGIIHMSWDIEKNMFHSELISIRPHTILLKLPQEFNEYEFECIGATLRKEEGFFKLFMENKGKVIITC